MSLDNETNLSCAALYPQDDYKVIAAVRAATGPISIALSTVAIFINLVNKKYRFQFHQMVLYMSIGGVLRGISASFSRVDYRITNDATRTFCVAIGFEDTYANLVIVLSTVALACNISADFVSHRSGEQRHRPLWLLIIFVFPLTVLWIPFLYSAYGRSPNVPWCAIRTMDDNCTTFAFGQAVSVALSVVIAILGSVVVILYVAVVVALVRRQRQWTIDPDDAKINRQLKREALIFAIPTLAFTAAFIVSFGNAIVLYTFGYVKALWITEAAYNPTAIAAFILTAADSELCRKPRSLFTLTSKPKVNEYKLESVYELENSDHARPSNA